ncbi:histidinol-phosphate aminotransferase family protein [Candidatus Woesearchaeota archaeon]|nr:histidinol-phosphate aminotransferase family protein [Candidatus Woesearchaeota archaeon]
MARADIEQIIKKAKEVCCLVVLDEAYWQYYGKTNYNFIMKYDNVIILQTFSKAYGLAGVRIGYAIAQESVLSILEKLRPPYSINMTAIIAATVALDDQEYVNSYVKEVSEAKQLLEKFARENNIIIYPTGSNFCIMKVGDKNKEIITALKKEGIVLRELTDSQILGGCIRIGIGNKEQTFILISALKRILEKNKF